MAVTDLEFLPMMKANPDNTIYSNMMVASIRSHCGLYLGLIIAYRPTLQLYQGSQQCCLIPTDIWHNTLIYFHFILFIFHSLYMMKFKMADILFQGSVPSESQTYCNEAHLDVNPFLCLFLNHLHYGKCFRLYVPKGRYQPFIETL